MPRLATRSESSIQRTVVEYARRCGIVCIKLHSPGFGSAGWPDYLFVAHRGIGGGQRIWFIEFKRVGGKLTDLQQHRAQELCGRAQVYMVDNVALGKEIIDREMAL